MIDYIVADIETDPFKDWEYEYEQRLPVAFAAGVYDGTNTFLFWGHDCLVKLVAKISEYGKRVCYFHNGGNFDFHFLLPHLKPLHCEYLLISKRIVQLICPGKEGTEYRDSFALVPRPLRDWMKDDIDIRKLEANVRERHKEEILSYLTTDLRSLFTLMEAAHKRLKKDALTQASAAFRMLLDSIGEKLPRISPRFDELLRPYYYAGRVQAWAMGELDGMYDVYDINSAFPHSMLSLHWWGSGGDVVSELPNHNREQCFIDLEGESLGCFPVRKDLKVEYPIGKGEFSVTGWEFEQARKLNLIRDYKIKRVIVPKMLMSYEDFVLPRYAEKLAAEKSGDLPARMFSKLELCSAYGKFGEDPASHRVVKCETYGKMLPSPWEICHDNRELGLTFWQRPAHCEPGDTPATYKNVAVAASITGKVRTTLMHATHTTKAVYCDTDSVFCPLGNGHALDVGSGLGQWKHEFTFTELGIAGRKLYSGYGFDPNKPGKMKFKYASKGAPLTPYKITRVCRGETIKSNFAAPSFSLVSGTKFISRRIRLVPANTQETT